MRSLRVIIEESCTVQVARKAAATEVVIEKLEEEFRIEHAKLAAAYYKTLKPKCDADTKHFFKSFGEAYAIFADLQKTRQDLFVSQIGFNGLFAVDLDFMRGEEVRKMFVDAKAAGCVASIPESLLG